ncbi:MAG TPA: Rsd/AlgQ family anti-sigma factor, partial [Chromatiales bacterium]|nr:Rsd/AlgQ family anti-sigma factor [Chromatiales bacterium]HEX22835.1 Rsd/AlgQ family anti-sigma factor [Chromatiales bacterium]
TALLREFCQQLVDYVAAGHFVLFEQLLKDSAPEVRSVAKELFPKLEASASDAIDFNDAYADGADIGELDALWADLSALGEVLAARAEAEDALILVLRNQAGRGEH